MKYLLTGSQMQQIDQYAIMGIGIPSMVLMERAALAVTNEIIKRAKKVEAILVACGTGNNGADGIAIARMLHLSGYHITLVFMQLEVNGTTEWNQQLEIAKNLNIPMISMEEIKMQRCDILVDAVFGVGLCRPIQGMMGQFIDTLNQLTPRLVLAVDMPSGINADQGAVMGIAIKADITITFGYQKLGTALYPGKGYAGEVIVCDIGFPEPPVDWLKKAAFAYEQQDIEKIPQRNADGNKGSFGKVLIVAGSANMSGAAYLSALAAYRMGSGLVKILTVAENRSILQQQLPEAILQIYEPQWIIDCPDELTQWAKQTCQWPDVIVLGPGLGQEKYVDYLVKEMLAAASVPMIIDADAINCLAKHGQLTERLTKQMILTPHLAEMARLNQETVSDIQSNLIDTAKQFSDKKDVICVLKDAVTIVTGADQPVYLNSSGNSSMAKAGSGDVLTGVIAGLLALEMKPYDAAVLGVYLHGLAGDAAREKQSIHGLLASDIANQVGKGLGR